MGAKLSCGSGSQLLRAARQGDDETVRKLLKDSAKAATHIGFWEGHTALHLAAEHGQLDLMKQVVATAKSYTESSKSPRRARRAVQDFLNHQGAWGQTALMIACRSGQIHIVRWLIENGADPLLLDCIQSRTCLHYAALYGRHDVISLLLTATTTIVTLEGTFRLRDVMMTDAHKPYRHKPARYIDLPAGTGFSALHMAVAQGQVEAVEMLLEHGASLAGRCTGRLWGQRRAIPWKSSSTPLHVAAACGNSSVVRAILQAYMTSAEVRDASSEEPDIREARDLLGHRPYDIAIHAQNFHIANALNPDNPLEPSLLRDQNLPYGPPSLVALCAGTVRSRLAVDLAVLESEQEEAKRKAATLPKTAPPQQAGAADAKPAAASQTALEQPSTAQRAPPAATATQRSVAAASPVPPAARPNGAARSLSSDLARGLAGSRLPTAPVDSAARRVPRPAAPAGASSDSSTGPAVPHTSTQPAARPEPQEDQWDARAAARFLASERLQASRGRRTLAIWGGNGSRGLFLPTDPPAQRSAQASASTAAAQPLSATDLAEFEALMRLLLDGVSPTPGVGSSLQRLYMADLPTPRDVPRDRQRRPGGYSPPQGSPRRHPSSSSSGLPASVHVRLAHSIWMPPDPVWPDPASAGAPAGSEQQRMWEARAIDDDARASGWAVNEDPSVQRRDARMREFRAILAARRRSLEATPPAAPRPVPSRTETMLAPQKPAVQRRAFEITCTTPGPAREGLPDATPKPAKQEKEALEPAECAICCDRSVGVAADPCGHSFCRQCAATLVQQGPHAVPATCPFCRRIMGRFKRV